MIFELRRVMDLARARIGPDLVFSLAVSCDVADVIEDQLGLPHMAGVEAGRPNNYPMRRSLFLDGVRIRRLNGIEAERVLVCFDPVALGEE